MVDRSTCDYCWSSSEKFDIRFGLTGHIPFVVNKIGNVWRFSTTSQHNMFACLRHVVLPFRGDIHRCFDWNNLSFWSRVWKNSLVFSDARRRWSNAPFAHYWKVSSTLDKPIWMVVLFAVQPIRIRWGMLFGNDGQNTIHNYTRPRVASSLAFCTQLPRSSLTNTSMNSRCRSTVPALHVLYVWGRSSEWMLNKIDDEKGGKLVKKISPIFILGFLSRLSSVYFETIAERRFLSFLRK